jgi:hypothetical protein
MTVEQLKSIVQIIIGLNPKMWEKHSLTNIMSSPVYLDTMLSIFIGHSDWLGSLDQSPLRSPYETKIQAPASDDQHRQLWSLISTGCTWKFLQEADIQEFITKGLTARDQLAVEFANFVNRSGELTDWYIDGLVSAGLGQETYTRFLNHHKNPKLDLFQKSQIS